MKQVPKSDPIAAFQRQTTSALRLGLGARCSCGESRPEALISNSNPISCAGCDRARRGKAGTDNHHVAGKANNSTTIPIPVNDHRARLSVAQYDWPKQTRENPDGSPLLAAAACIRGFIDTITYVIDTILHLIDKLLLWIPEMLEGYDAFLVKALGRKYWLNTELEQFVRKR